MIRPESGLNPLMLPVIRVAVHEKVADGLSAVKMILVDSPEQMVLERGLFVTEGGAIFKS